MTEREQNIDTSYERLWEIIKDCRYAMLITADPDGSLRSRPMTTVQKEFSGRLWFYAPLHSDAVRSIEENANVCVAYADSAAADFVSISGTASIVTDPTIKQKFWSPMVEAWFPQGPAAPDLTLIKVYADRAEYWDSKSNKLVQLFYMASAYLKRSPPQNIGEHREVRIE